MKVECMKSLSKTRLPTFGRLSGSLQRASTRERAALSLPHSRARVCACSRSITITLFCNLYFAISPSLLPSLPRSVVSVSCFLLCWFMCGVWAPLGLEQRGQQNCCTSGKLRHRLSANSSASSIECATHKRPTPRSKTIPVQASRSVQLSAGVFSHASAPQTHSDVRSPTTYLEEHDDDSEDALNAHYP